MECPAPLHALANRMKASGDTDLVSLLAAWSTDLIPAYPMPMGLHTTSRGTTFRHIDAKPIMRRSARFSAQDNHGPARIIAESLTPRPGLRGQHQFVEAQGAMGGLSTSQCLQVAAKNRTPPRFSFD